MNILLSSSHRYPALRVESAGFATTRFPSGSAYMTQDLLAKGLAELGHNVFYFLRNGADASLPNGITLVNDINHEVDIHHMLIDSDEYNFWQDKPWSAPRVISCHIDPRVIDRYWGETTDQWIFVSKSLAVSLGKERFVWNGIDPDEYVFSESKQDYFMFMSAMDWAFRKGLDKAISLVQTLGTKLVVAGGSSNPGVIKEIESLCADHSNIEYVGDVRGTYKSKLLAEARGLIFPTRVNEAFGLVIAEALMSGTPIICSDSGACGEIVSSEVGFVCRHHDDYIRAMAKIDMIKPVDCRARALKEFHYKKMAERFIDQYERELRGR